MTSRITFNPRGSNTDFVRTALSSRKLRPPPVSSQPKCGVTRQAYIPAGNFRLVLVCDAMSRSELQNGQPFPSVGSFTKPVVNPDGSIDILFGPDEPKAKPNCIKTVPGKGRGALLPHQQQDIATGERCENAGVRSPMQSCENDDQCSHNRR
jgi:hypothetical protein